MNRLADLKEKIFSYRFMVAILLAFFFLALLWGFSLSVHIDRILLAPENIAYRSLDHDTAEYTILLPRLAEREHFCLMFKSVGNVVEVREEGRLIYEYGQDYAARREDIGRVYSSVVIPEEASQLTVLLRASDSSAHQNILKFEICREKDAIQYYLTNDTLGFFLAMFFIVIGLCYLGAALILWRSWKLSRLTCYLGLILLCMSVELLDTGGHYLAFGRNQHVWNYIFYIDCYLIPIPCMLYSRELLREKLSPRERKKLSAGMLLLTVYGISVIGIVFLTELRFCDFMPAYIFFLILCGAMAVYGVYLIFKRKMLTRNNLFFVPIIAGWVLLAIILSIFSESLENVSAMPVFDSETIAAIFVFFSICYIFILAVAGYEREMQEKELLVLQLENELKDHKIRYFASQIQPHFLYNTLSSIQEIVLYDSEYASLLIGDFTTYLRSCIKSMVDEKLIPFTQELENIKAYARIEEMRFTDRLKIHYEINAEQFCLYPLSIQPLVENAIRHGIYKRGAAGGEVWVSSSETKEQYLVTVKDNGVGFDAEHVLKSVREKDCGAYGIRNLIYRLEEGMGATVEFQSEMGKGTEVTVRIPKKERRKRGIYEEHYC